LLKANRSYWLFDNDMMDQSRTDARQLTAIVADNEEWLIDRVLAYAKRQGYTRYMPTLRQAWRQSIAGLSEPLIVALKNGPPDIELSPDEDYTTDPLTRFGIIEARRHRKRGVDLSMFLGLMKYCRQSYMDLVDHESKDPEQRQRLSLFLKRFFDRIEIGLVTAWHAPRKDSSVADPRLANRIVTNEKNKYLTIFESMKCPVAVLDLDRCVTAVNHAWAVLFGLSETPGADYYNTDGTGRSVAWLAAELDALDIGGTGEESLEKSIDTSEGVRHFIVTFKRMLDVSEKFTGIVVTLNDITQQKEAETALQETTIWLTEMFNALEDAVFIETPNGRIVNANHAVRDIFGYTVEELKDRNTEILHVNRDRFEAFTAKVREALAKEDKATFEYPARRKNGEFFPAMIYIARLKKADGSPLGIVSILRDISALKEAEEAASKSDRFEGALELAGAVCHDMNQPLMAITGYAELLLMDCPKDSHFSGKLNKIAEQVAKMGDITQKLMRVTRYETKAYLDQRIIDIDKASDG
jgi:PAS domain S-box-containing protein